MRNKLTILTIFSALVLAGCGNNGGNNDKKPTPVDPRKNEVSVFVLSGQSNMEGSSYWKHKNGTPLLENYMNEESLDFESVQEGLENVYTSYYGFYYPSKWTQANSSSEDKSTPEGRMTPNFLPTTVGMGVADNPGLMMGPEVGLAYKLNEEVDEEHPVYLIKCAFSGSGFEKTDGPNWTSREDDPNKSLFYLLKEYTRACLETIEETGKKPILKGFLWHQGESDGGNSKYREYTETLVGDFRDEFEDYARDEDGDNIAFIDCTIYDGKGKSTMSYGTAANAAKLAIANEDLEDLNFCIDAGFGEGGLKLEIGDDALGGYNMYHYNTSDCFRLGEAYADIIIDNEILDI